MRVILCDKVCDSRDTVPLKRLHSLDESCLEGKDRKLFKNMRSLLSKRSKSLIPAQAKLVTQGNRNELNE